jgi:multidrug efflux pump subunit AcrB
MISKFFIKHPIIAIVISIVMVIVGTVSMLTLSVAQYPEIVPPEILTHRHIPGSRRQDGGAICRNPDRKPDERRGQHELHVFHQREQWLDKLHTDFDVKTDPNIDQILTQLRVNQAASQMPTEVSMQGVQVMKSMSTPLMLFNLISPQGTYNRNFLVNYGIINLKDEIARVPGVGRVEALGGEYSMRIWVRTSSRRSWPIYLPVSLIGTFIVFPMLGFSINTLSLFGLILAIGLVVDDAIVVVEAVEHHMEEGLSPHDATVKAMEEVSGPVIAIALILAAVFIP